MQHHFVNRRSRPDRRYLWTGAMASQGVKPDEIVRHLAMDIDDYKTPEEVCEAAREEFPEYFTFHLYNPQRHIGFGHLVISWSIMRMWREIASGTEIAGAWIDDYALRVPHAKLRELAESVQPDILQLAWHLRDDVFLRNDYDLPVSYQAPAHLSRHARFPALWQGTRGCAEWCMLLSPRGARLLLEFIAWRPYYNTEIAVPAFYFETWDSGVYSVVANHEREHGVMTLKNNGWVCHLVEYTDGIVSDVEGMHEREVAS